MGGDSRSEGKVFESQNHIQYVVYHIDLLQKYICLKKTKKRPGMAQFFNTWLLLHGCHARGSCVRTTHSGKYREDA